MNFWIKNTDGERDAVLTMTLMGFVVVLIKFALSGVSLGLGSSTFVFAPIDAATVGALLTPTLGAYVARRYTDRNHEIAMQKLQQEPAQPSIPEKE